MKMKMKMKLLKGPQSQCKVICSISSIKFQLFPHFNLKNQSIEDN